MKQIVTLLCLAFFASVPMWLTDPYLLNALITTGIFIIGAMSLNLLLGFTGQLSLGHIAFFGIGAYVSALTSLGSMCRSTVISTSSTCRGRRLRVSFWRSIISGFCGYLVGRLSFSVRGAYFVIVTISFAEVVQAGGAELGRADAGPAGADQYSVDHHRSAGAWLSRAEDEVSQLLSCAGRRRDLLFPDLASRSFALRPRHARADGERDAGVSPSAST